MAWVKASFKAVGGEEEGCCLSVGITHGPPPEAMPPEKSSHSSFNIRIPHTISRVYFLPQEVSMEPSSVQV